MERNAIFFHVSFIIYTKSCFCINEKGVIYTKRRFCINENLYFTLPKFQKEYDKGADKSGDQHTLGARILS